MPGQFAPSFGTKGYDAGGTGVEQTNSVLLEDPLDEDATPFRRRRTQAICPEHRLLMALVETALHLLVSTSEHRRRTSVEWQEAYDWIFSDEEHLFSFRYACEHLDLDSGIAEIRADLRRRLAANDRRPLLFQSRAAERNRGHRNTHVVGLRSRRRAVVCLSFAFSLLFGFAGDVAAFHELARLPTVQTAF